MSEINLCNICGAVSKERNQAGWTTIWTVGKVGEGKNTCPKCTKTYIDPLFSKEYL